MRSPAPSSVEATPPAQPHHRHHRFRNTLLAGLVILAPIYVTAYVLWVLFHFMDGIFAPIIDRTLGALVGVPRVHIPGLGLLLTLLVILLLGWLSASVVGRRSIAAGEAVIRRIPIAKSVYGATKGVLEALSRDQADAFKRVVLVEYPRRGIYGIGFVTGGEARWPSTDQRTEELVPVFVPTTPNPTSGYLLLVPPGELIDCAVTVEEGIRMVISGGILQPAALIAASRTAPAAVSEPALK